MTSINIKHLKWPYSHLYLSSSLSTTERTTGFLSTESSKGDRALVKNNRSRPYKWENYIQVNILVSLTSTKQQQKSILTPHRFTHNNPTSDDGYRPCRHHEVGEQVEDNVVTGWRVVSEADRRDKVNEECIALLSEVAIFFYQGPICQKTYNQIKLVGVHWAQKYPL